MGSSDNLHELEEQKRRLEEQIAQTKQKAMKAQREALERKKKEESAEKEVDLHIHFTPQKILKGALLVLLILAAFVLGRISADDTSDNSSEGFFSKLFSKTSSGEAAKAPTAVAVSAPEEKTIIENTEPAPEEEAPPAPEPETTAPTETSTGTEKIVSADYKSVTTILNDVTIDWKGTWGKITHIDYTIKNGEAGTVKPDYFIMTLEGYDDFEKKIPNAIAIAAGQSDSAIVTVPNGFAYNEATTGDLTNVQITLTLYDDAGKQMATFQKEFNLKVA